MKPELRVDQVINLLFSCAFIGIVAAFMFWSVILAFAHSWAEKKARDEQKK